METVSERSQFDAVRQHMQMVRNYLHTVISPEEILLREAMQEYALSLQQQALSNAA